MKSRPVFCPNCSFHVRGDDINIHELIGKCERCDHVFPLNLNGITREIETSGPEPSRPSGILMERGLDNDLLIVRRWFDPGLYFLLFFCIAWDGFLIFWYSVALFGDMNANGFEWMPVLFPICHVAVGVCLTYCVLAGFLNESTIYLDREMLCVRHGPVPWYGNRDLLVEEVQGIELDYVYSSNDQPRYSVCAHVDEGRQVVLLGGVKCKQAEYIAWQIANSLSVPLSQSKSPPQFRSGLATCDRNRGDLKGERFLMSPAGVIIRPTRFGRGS